MENTIIRVQKFEEIKEIIKHFDKMFSPALSERVLDLDTYANKLRGNAYVYAAYAGPVCLGFVAFYANDRQKKVGYLAQIAVDPDYRNQGIGQSLLQLFTEVSKKNGMKTLMLEVFRQNYNAINFYEKNGFKYCGDASIDTLYMAKDCHQE